MPCRSTTTWSASSSSSPTGGSGGCGWATAFLGSERPAGDGGHAVDAVEAVGAVTRFAFEALDARLVTVGHAAPNAASANLIRTLGFERITVLPLGCEMPDGTLVDGIGYAMTDPSALPPLRASW